MSLPTLLTTAGEFLVLRADIVDKLLKCGDGDGALLYLYILRHGKAFDEKRAPRDLGFSQDRYDRAVFTLTSLELAGSQAAPQPAPVPQSPAYTASELRQARGGDHRFSAVCDAAESVLGRTLTESLLRSLFTAYDHLGLPAEVIIELLSYLKREKDLVKKRDIEQEACLWADMGLFTVEDAAAYLARRDAERPLISAMREALSLPLDREPTATESRCLSDFIAQGFPPDAVALAGARTQRALGKFSWKYMSKILSSWDQKGVHTLSEITAVEPERDSLPARPSTGPAAPNTGGQLTDWERQWLQDVEARKKRRGEET